MAGFPQRPQRAAFGAPKEMPVGRVIQNARVELGPDPLNLLFDQVAGAGLLAPLLVAVVDPLANGGAGEFLHLRTVNDQQLGFEIITVSATVTRIRVARGTIPNENGASVTVADAQANPATLSLQLIATMAAETQFHTALSLDSGARVEVDIAPGADFVDIDCTRVAQSVWRPFVVLGWSRNGGSA